MYWPESGNPAVGDADPDPLMVLHADEEAGKGRHAPGQQWGTETPITEVAAAGGARRRE